MIEKSSIIDQNYQHQSMSKLSMLKIIVFMLYIIFWWLLIFTKLIKKSHYLIFLCHVRFIHRYEKLMFMFDACLYNTRKRRWGGRPTRNARLWRTKQSKLINIWHARASTSTSSCFSGQFHCLETVIIIM